MPALHEVPQPLAPLRVQAHATLPHRLPERQQDGSRLRRSFPDQASQDRQQDPVPVGQVVLVETPDVPSQARRLQGRPVDLLRVPM